MFIIGLMSGTSADGTEAALMEIKGEYPKLRWRLIRHLSLPYMPETRQAILDCCEKSRSGPQQVCELNFALGRIFARAAREVCQAAGMDLDEIDLIASHGQTIWHQPSGPNASTLQIGEAALIAGLSGVTTLSNFRPADMVVGGQGAPLVPLADRMLFMHHKKTRVCQNIGGIANLTWLPPYSEPSADSAHEVLAFDSGPGNMLIDQAMRRHTDGRVDFDEDGQQASWGRVDEELLESWLEQEPYFWLSPPKSSGREKFNAAYEVHLWGQSQECSLSFSSYLATLTALTSRSIAKAIQTFCPLYPDEVILSGGGTQNLFMMKLLKEDLKPAAVLTSDEMGLKSAAKEAAAFAILGYETWHQRPGNLPSATGADSPAVLGSITPGRNWGRLMNART